MAYCPECGKKVAEKATFCANCGKKIKTEESKPEIKEEKPAPKEEPKKESVASTAPAEPKKSSSGSSAGWACGIIGILFAIFVVVVCVFGFFALSFIGAKGQPGTLAKPTDIVMPKSLTASESSSAIDLNWKKSDTTNVTKYNIYKSTKNSADFKLLSSVENPTLTYKDTAITKGITYYYYVTASTREKESGNSNQVSYVLAPAPLIPQSVTSWKDVLDKYNADAKYAKVLGDVTGLSKADIEKYVSLQDKGKKLKTTLEKGTIITNTMENYKIIPSYVLPQDKEFLTDDKGNAHIMMYCGNPIKFIKKPSKVVEAIQNFTTNIINIFPVSVTNIIINASQPLSTFVVGILPNSFGTTVMNPEATDTNDQWPADEVLIDQPDPSKTPDIPLTEGQQWASHGKILLEASPADPAPGESVTMYITLFPIEAGVSVDYSVSGTDGYTASGTITTGTDGKTSFYIPGGAAGVVDSIDVKVPVRGDEGTTSYSF